jgi:hypothetical protein
VTGVPAQTLRGGAGDGLAQHGVGDALDDGLDGGGEGHLGRRGAHLGSRGRALRRVDVTDAEAERLHGHAAAAELVEDGVGEERQLLRPGGRGGADHEHAAIEPDRARPRGDAAAHGGLPVARGDGRGLDRAGHAQPPIAREHEPERLQRSRARPHEPACSSS